MQPVAYAYIAAVHCIECTRRAADVGLLERRPPLSLLTDPHGIALDLCDREGNPVTPIFPTDDRPADYCDDCGAAYGGAPERVPLYSVDAWRDADGGWYWNSWAKRGTAPAEWCDLKPRALLHRLRAETSLNIPAPGRAVIDDDGHNLTICHKGTREPVAALAYGEAR